jgi:hypothetical protein
MISNKGQRRSASAGRCEEAFPIDLAWLRRGRLLEAGSQTTLHWSHDGCEQGRVLLRVLSSGLELSTAGCGPMRIPFVATATRFGGHRVWLKCGGCGRRCRIIYAACGFRCRRCARLHYQSQYDPMRFRGLAPAQRIRERLGGSASLIEEFPSRPKRMRWETYWRLRAWCKGIEGQWVRATRVQVLRCRWSSA